MGFENNKTCGRPNKTRAECLLTKTRQNVHFSDNQEKSFGRRYYTTRSKHVSGCHLGLDHRKMVLSAPMFCFVFYELQS